MACTWKIWGWRCWTLSRKSCFCIISFNKLCYFHCSRFGTHDKFSATHIDFARGGSKSPPSPFGTKHTSSKTWMKTFSFFCFRDFQSATTFQELATSWLAWPIPMRSILPLLLPLQISSRILSLVRLVNKYNYIWTSPKCPNLLCLIMLAADHHNAQWAKFPLFDSS